MDSISKNAKEVNSYLATKLKGNPPQLYTAASHLIVNGGKRLRPFLVTKSCEILGIDNLRDFFKALEAVLNKVSFQNKKRISQMFDQALGIGFFKFQEIAKRIEAGSDLHEVEVLVDVENLYQIAKSNNL